MGWEPLGFQPVFFSEIEPFPKALLKHRFPQVPDLGNLLDINGSDWRGKLDIFWGSTPCQSFSLAGKRASITDDRGKLTMKFCELADEINPSFVCWENVKGALSASENAFGCLLGALSGEGSPLEPPGGKWTHAGYVLGPKRNIAWRLFDAQYSGVAQRRERLFVIGCPTDGPDPREILFEQNTGSQVGRPSRSRESQNVDTHSDQGAAPRAYSVAFRGRAGGEQAEVGGEISNCLLASQGGSDKAFVLIDGPVPEVRMLTPRECERLMGFPDDWTNVPFDNGLASDAVRFKAIGNSIAVPDVRWIGKRILATS